MSTSRKILQMVADKKISSKEANMLLSKLEKQEVKKKLIIIVSQENKLLLRLSIPWVWVEQIKQPPVSNLEIGGSYLDFSSFNWAEIYNLAASGEEGELLHLHFQLEDGTYCDIDFMV